MTTTTTTTAKKTTTTTPNEFLQFATTMGLEQIKSTNLANNNGYSLTGLSVLNNLCHLIEQIHQLKAENDRLRAHLDLVNHVDKFLSKTTEDKSLTLSPSNSLKIKKLHSPTLSISSRERQGGDFINNPDDSSSMIHMEAEMMDSNLGLSTLPAWNNWGKVRHALKFSLRRKPEPPVNPGLAIPAISISVESDDDHLHENKYQKKKKKMILINDSRRDLIGEDTDHDDESIDSTRLHEKRELYQNNQRNSSSLERHEINLQIDDEHSLARKQSKIAHYRRKIRSKLNTVKKQFSDQNTSSSLRVSSGFDDIGSGLNHALLTAKLAPAMTKSYQQKMREWQTMQKSQFLVNYRRQSITTKIELNNESRKPSIVSTINETIDEPEIQSTDKLIPEIKPNILALSPTLSPNQRSLIVHQWREIMSEEISLRHYSEYFHRKIQELKQLEVDLKYLKTKIFSTNNQEYFLKHRSLTSIDQLDQDLLEQYRSIYLPKRSRSLQSLVSTPASWILAVQSAAYSDILDGTSKKTTDRAIIYDRNFFQQLQHFKNDRHNFEQDTCKHLPILNNSKTNISFEENFNEKRVIPIRPRIILTRAYLRKLTYTSPSEIPQLNPMIPLQTTISKFETTSHIDLLTISETESTLPSSSSTTLNKRLKRSRFDFKKTLQRSKSMCMTQFNSWLQRRRQHLSVPRRKSAIEPKTNKESRLSRCSTPTLLGSPRLARLHQRIFKQHPSPVSPPPTPTPVAAAAVALPIEIPSRPEPLDDSDEYFRRQECPVRIYLPARTSPITRHVRITDTEIKTPPMSKLTSPIITRRNLSSSIKPTTAKERRESYALLTNILNNQ